MAKKTYSEFYPGKKKKKRQPALIISIIAGILLMIVLLVFYGGQKYIVVTNDGLYLDVPMLNGGEPRFTVSEEGIVEKTYAPVEIDLKIGEADYSNVDATAGEELAELKAVYISAPYATPDGIRAAAASLNAGNALVIELKPASGMLGWNSGAEFALAYGTASENDITSVIGELHDQGVYLVAELTCLMDNTVPDRNPKVALKTPDGSNFTDGTSMWIDPYSSEYRKYIVDLCKELAAMGFDEIELNGIRHPEVEGQKYVYPGTTNPEVTPTTASCGFALSITRSLKNQDIAVSVRLNSDTAFLEGADAASGQNAELFFKIFDRVYYYVSVTAAATALETAQQYIELGDVNMRLVPVCYGSTPGTDCWVFMG